MSRVTAKFDTPKDPDVTITVPSKTAIALAALLCKTYGATDYFLEVEHALLNLFSESQKMQAERLFDDWNFSIDAEGDIFATRPGA